MNIESKDLKKDSVKPAILWWITDELIAIEKTGQISRTFNGDHFIGTSDRGTIRQRNGSVYKGSVEKLQETFKKEGHGTCVRHENFEKGPAYQEKSVDQNSR